MSKDVSNDYDKEYFAQISEGSRKSAEVIIPKVIDFFHPKSVIDVGCGTGIWLSIFHAYGVDIFGIDGDYIDSSQLAIPKKNFLQIDLASDITFNKTFDLAVCLEVAEHLSRERAESFIHFLTSVAPIVIFSAAIPGQIGVNHINCQWPSYWIDIFSKNRYRAFDILRKDIWNNHGIMPWYRQNIFVFIREDHIILYEKVLNFSNAIISIVHPEIFAFTESQLHATTAELHATTAELHATTAELHATTAEFLAIKKTILWRISKKMYVLFDRYFPNHSYRRNQAFRIVQFLKKLARFLKSLHFLYEKHKRTPSTRLVYTVLKKRRKNFLKNIRRKYNKAAVYVSSRGNYFYDEIFELICCGLEDLGFDIKRCNEHVGFVDDVDWHIIVAPHEFFLLSGLGSVREREMPENVILITSEQEGTPWFEACRRYFVKAYALWDINYEMSIQLKRAYKYVSYLPLGYSERFRLYPEIKTLPHNYFTSFFESKVVNFSISIFAWKDRPIDIVFFCTGNERRNTFFSKNAHFFSKYRCHFIFKDILDGPFPVGDASALNTDTVIGIIQRSKILLNIHSGTAKYFESHRIVMNGIWNKALVISEPCNEQPPYIPNRDFVVCDTSRICDRIEYFLSPEGHEDAKEIIENAYRTLTKECTMSRSLEKCIAELYHA